MSLGGRGLGQVGHPVNDSHDCRADHQVTARFPPSRQEQPPSPRRPRQSAVRVTRPAGAVKLKLGTFWVLQGVDQHAHAHGWSRAMLLRARRTLIPALNERPVGKRVSRAELRARGGPKHLLAPLLAGLDLLDEEPDEDPLARLIDKRTAGLPDGMRTDIAAWMTVLRDGDARTRPKSWKTVVEYSRNVRPLLLAWGRRHQHLRELTSTDVRRAVAAVPAGSARQNTFVAIRALFRFLRRDRRIFTNPTSHLHQGRRHEPAVLPLAEQDYQRVTERATSELHRVVLVLVAVHGARPHMLRELRLADVNLTRRRLTVAGVTRELDDLSLRVLSDWLRHRRTRWPLSANPHLLVSRLSAHGTQPISDTFLKDLFRGSGITLDRLRMDRNLEEALAYGPDPLHLAALFGISDATAIRYTNQARLLLAPSAGPSSK